MSLRHEFITAPAVFQNRNHAAREPFDIQGIEEHRGAVQGFFQSGNAAGNYWSAASHGLEWRQTETFIQRRIDKGAARRIEGAQIVIIQITRQTEVLTNLFGA